MKNIRCFAVIGICLSLLAGCEPQSQPDPGMGGSTPDPGGGGNQEEAAYFAFQQGEDPARFVFKLTDPEKIAHARALLAGETQERQSVSGRLALTPAPYNPDWSYHMEPGTIDFFDMAIGTCDANMQAIEDNLEQVGDTLLPDLRWCPWSSGLVEEVEPENPSE